MDRIASATKHLDLTGRGIEMGPSYNPVVSKRSGAKIETVDHAPREVLVEKYREYGVPPEKVELIEEVDHLWSGGPLRDVVTDHGGYDYVIASHFVEHTVDLVEFLVDCQTLLADHGRLGLIVPDKRHTFDAWRPLTSVGQLIDATAKPQPFHPPGAHLDHHVYACTQDGQLVWSPGTVRPLELQRAEVLDGREVVQSILAADEYVDTHRWIFTPMSFALLVEDLHRLGCHELWLHQLPESGGYEFFVTLAKEGDFLLTDRAAALTQIEDELSASRLAKQRGEYEAQLTAMEQERERIWDQLEASRQALADLHASTSWRITAPMRWASQRVRRR